MNCREWEERLALYAGGDLGRSEAEEVERHTAGCPGCQVTVSGLKQAVETLRLGHAELPPDAAFGAVRARVMAALRHRRRPLWKRAWIYGLAAASLAMAAALRLATPPAPVSPVAVARRPEQNAEAGSSASAEQRPGASGRSRRRTGRAVARPMRSGSAAASFSHEPGAPAMALSALATPAAPEHPALAPPEHSAAAVAGQTHSTRESLVVHYTTDNPGIVILWIAEKTGE